MFNAIVDCDTLHSFMRDTHDEEHCEEFTIERLHEHCSIAPAKDDFLDTFALASNDRLGAYSRNSYPCTPSEREVVKSLFSSIGDFMAFTIIPGTHEGCDGCRRYREELFSTWFDGVAWDYVHFVTWPDQRLFWMGCMTDTD